MRKDIHPEVKTLIVSYACGAEHEVVTTKDHLRLDICSKCHPFYTGKQKIVDTAGRIDKFKKRYANVSYGKKKK